VSVWQGPGPRPWSREAELHHLDSLSGEVHRLQAEGNPRAERLRRRIEVLRMAVELADLIHA
jgi:hypothetical protein